MTASLVSGNGTRCLRAGAKLANAEPGQCGSRRLGLPIADATPKMVDATIHSKNLHLCTETPAKPCEKAITRGILFSRRTRQAAAVRGMVSQPSSMGARGEDEDVTNEYL